MISSRTLANLAALALALALSPSLAQGSATPGQTAEPNKASVSARAQDNKPAAIRVARSASSRKRAPTNAFRAMAGSWSGGGTISLSGGTRERLRCRAHHSIGQSATSLSLSIRCASDSYRFDLTSRVVERRGQIYGTWSESSNNVSGSIRGRAHGNRIQAVAHGDSFSAGLYVKTVGNRQSVSITPKGVFITGVHVSLTK